MKITKNDIRHIIRETINRIYEGQLDNPWLGGRHGSKTVKGVYDFFTAVEKTVFAFEGNDGFEECADYIYENENAFIIPVTVRISYDESVGLGEAVELENIDEEAMAQCEEVIDNMPSSEIASAAKQSLEEEIDEISYDFNWDRFESREPEYEDDRDEY